MAKILVVDDEPSIVNLVAAYLKPEGYEIHTASDGPSGLKAARAFKPDLIILDIMLPGMDGMRAMTITKGAWRLCWLPIGGGPWASAAGRWAATEPS